MRHVGYWISEKKRKKLDFEEQRELFRNAGIELVKIDLNQPLENQGPIDVLVHKYTDLFVMAQEGDDSAENALFNLETYIQNHPECVVLDPLDSVRRLMNRYTQYQCVEKCEAMKDNRCMIPAFVELDTADINENKEKLARGGVKFPLIIKPILAHGPAHAHQMSLIFSEDSLNDISVPCVAQSFINHNAVLYKIMVIGCKHFIIQRPSLKNLYPGNYPTVSFDSQEVSKADSNHPLNEVDYATLKDQLSKPDWVYFDQLAHSMRKTMELDLFGFDVIIDCKTNQYDIIDVNFFPGFEAVDGFFDVLLEHIVNVLNASGKGELENGRLVAPHVSANITILDQLNLQARFHKNHLAGPPEGGFGDSVSYDKSSSLLVEGNNNLVTSTDDAKRRAEVNFKHSNH